MTLDPHTPVIVGVGQVTNRPDADGTASLADRPEPIGLMVDAVRAAVEDCDGSPAGGTAPGGRRLLGRIQSLRVADPLSWAYVNPGLSVAEALGVEPAQLMVTTTGGNNPQSLVNATSLAIGRGELDVAVVVGADCVYTRTATRRHAERPLLPWTVQPADTLRPTVFGNDRRGVTEAEEERGLDLPIHVFPLFENALRAEAGRSLDEHRDRLGELWSRFSEVASSNPDAWLPQVRSAHDIAAVSDTNRMIAYPYTKLLTANMQVDQGAALILCSVAAARAAGVPEDRWVFPRAGADADDHWFLSHRLDFHSSPAIRLAGASALSLAGTAADEIAHVDLYSCFPSAVQIAAAELGLPLDDPDRSLTVTGGMTFGGGPGNNYGTHAVASMVGELRADPGSLGLVTGLGWYLSKHSVGIYGTEPAPDRADATALPDGTATEETAGFAWANSQAAVGALPQCSPDADATGEVTVETYSVAYERTGSPAGAVVACRTPEGRRSWASVTDPDQLAVLVTEEGCGRLGLLRGDGQVDLS
ncbi:MAG TPA: acetyl-CoA acetyltransferase [Acidimicrobiales bacterium]|jgi:acetyl-CoA C-acetyltransferase|nr:acetyl-CoA acetyltransferase [Acidimicrobiales bacterium]